MSGDECEVAGSVVLGVLVLVINFTRAFIFLFKSLMAAAAVTAPPAAAVPCDTHSYLCETQVHC